MSLRSNPRSVLRGLLLATAAAASATALPSVPLHATTAAPASGPERVAAGNIPRQVGASNRLGRADAKLQLDNLVLVLKRRPGTEADLLELRTRQQDPTLTSYHKWLTPEEFGKRFGVSDADLQAVISWLQSYDRTIL
jgi:hypothetical protein